MEDQVLTVSEITARLRQTIEKNPDFTSVWVKGEVYNLTYHSSGHIYFSLKDEGAVISAVFFKYANKHLRFKLEEGMSVIAFGSVTFYDKQGKYQLMLADLHLEGIGELQKRIEQLKKKLLADGIFDAEHKRPLPILPKRIGVVTAPTGAAFQDILKVALKRFPTIEILLAPAKVQGDDAAAAIVRGIEELNNPKWHIDVIIAGRGGGSFEDLMAFNEEPVVRAFYHSRVPIVSAVGHQIDHPLSDDAADAYAPTPSAAAELVVPEKADLAQEVDYLFLRIEKTLDVLLNTQRIRVETLAGKKIFRAPLDLFMRREMQLADAETGMFSSMTRQIHAARLKLAAIPDISRTMRARVKENSFRFKTAAGAIDQLSPLGVIARGYAVIQDAEGKNVKSVRQVLPGDVVASFIADGMITSVVQSTDQGVHLGKKEN